jgi:hypothetical protein
VFKHPISHSSPWTDRKPDSWFHLKGWIHSEYPNEYAFGVSEKIRQEVQRVDLTDDHSGQLHDIAKSKVTTYVNEVGDSGLLEQNVYSWECDGRTVHYYFKLDEPMIQGQTVELLTHYGRGYEDVRERQGYGYKCLNENLPGNQDRASRIARNIVERNFVLEKRICSANSTALADMIQFVYERIWVPLANKPVLATEDAVAYRRIKWLSEQWRLRTNQLLKMSQQYTSGSRDVAALTPITDLLDNIDRYRPPAYVNEASFMDEIREEYKQETLFTLRYRLERAFDDSLWCPLAADLLDELLNAATEHWDGTREDSLKLRERVLAITKDFANRVGSASQHQLSFSSGLREDRIIQGSLKDILENVSTISFASFLSDHHTAPKSVLAALVRYGKSIPENTILDCSGRFVMAGLSGSLACPEPLGIGSEPPINRQWYLVWQVVHPVVAFISQMLISTMHPSLDEIYEAASVERDYRNDAVIGKIRDEIDVYLRKQTMIDAPRNHKCAKPKHRAQKHPERPADREFIWKSAKNSGKIPRTTEPQAESGAPRKKMKVSQIVSRPSDSPGPSSGRTKARLLFIECPPTEEIAGNYQWPLGKYHDWELLLYPQFAHLF